MFIIKNIYLLILYGFIGELGYVYMHTNPDVKPFLVLLSLLFLHFYFFSYMVLKPGKKNNSKILYIIFAFAILYRLTVFNLEPLHDNDIYRYHWDGKVASNGINPYKYSPNNEKLKKLRDNNYWMVGFKHIPTIYPPFAQSLFKAGYFIDKNNMLGIKLIVLIFDISTVFIILLILNLLQKNPANLILYALNPLIIKEFSNSGHIDAIAVFFVTLMVYLYLKSKHKSAAVFLCLSILTKLYSIVLLPVFFIKKPVTWIIITFICLIYYLPYINDVKSLSIFKGLFTYTEFWLFNPGLFDIVNVFFSLFFKNHFFITRIVFAVSLLFLTMALAIIFHDSEKEKKIYLAFWVLGFLLLSSPVINPWYICWIVPFLCIYPNLSWLFFCFLVNLSYTYWINNEDATNIRLIEHSLFFAFLITETYLGIKRKTSSFYLKIISK